MDPKPRPRSVRRSSIERRAHRRLTLAHLGWRLLFAGAPLLAVLGAVWWRQRERRLGLRARGLDAVERAALAPYFDRQTLDAARVAWVDAVEEPAPLRWLRALPRPRWWPVALGGLQFGLAAGVTFGEVIAIRRPVASPEASLEPSTEATSSHEEADSCPLPLLFHELVHVVQVRQLGRRRFLQRYARGWLASGRRYRAIPLEEQAFRLERRFGSGEAPFSVEAIVAEELEALELLSLGWSSEG